MHNQQMNIFDFIQDQDTCCGKTFQERSVQTVARTSKQSSQRLSGSQTQAHPMCLCLESGGVRNDGQNLGACMTEWADGALLGEYMMRSFGVYPKEELESRLSQILEDCPHQKYSLSEKACLGILKRAEKRGKKLPPELMEALVKQSHFKNETESQGGKGILIQNDRTGALSTVNNQMVFDAVEKRTGCVYSIGHDERSARFTTDGKTDPLSACDYKQPPAVMYGKSAVQAHGVDSYNQTIDKEIAQSLRSAEGGDSSPKVLCSAHTEDKGLKEVKAET